MKTKLIKTTEIRLVPLLPKELGNAFDIYKAALHDVIEQVFGWDESFQRERFQNRYEPSWFHWIEADDERAGYVCFHETGSEIHVSLLIILPGWRGNSIGHDVMLTFHQRAVAYGGKITLSSFKANTGAVRFYEQLGYEVSGEDEHFLDLVWSAPS